MNDVEQIEAKLREARERRARRLEAREAGSELEAKRAEIAALEAEERVEEAIAKAEADGLRRGRTLAVVALTYPDGTPMGMVLVKRPNPMHWSKFENRIVDAKGIKNDEIRDELWQKCLVWPSLPEVERYLEEQPYTRQRLTDAIAVLAGFRKEEVSGKS